ncbi:MAG: ArsR family transcriptional regulator [Nitrososphaera sp.]|jgi:hypothetical protein
MKPSFSALRKYDVTSKILEILADAQSRTILFSTVIEGKTPIDLFDEHRIPLSTIYKKISELEEMGLLRIEKYVITDNGKRFKVYRSKISRADVTIKDIEPTVNLLPNRN